MTRRQIRPHRRAGEQRGIVRDNQLVRFKDGELVKQMPEADFDLVIAVNLKGVFNCAQAVAPVMIRQGGGVILNAELGRGA